MNSKRGYYIPRVINKNYIFLWNRDEAMFLMIPWIFWLVIGGLIGMLISLIAVIIVGQMLRFFGVGKANGYIRHWIYFNMPKAFARSWWKSEVSTDMPVSIFTRSETLPPSHIRHIAG